MRLALVALLLFAMASPAAADNVVETFQWPAPDVAFTPQLSCAFAFDEGGAERCEHFGSIFHAGALSVRVVGAGRAFAFLDDVSTPGVARQLVIADCAASCERTFPAATTAQARLHVDATGAPGALVYVWTHTTVQGTLERLGVDHLLA